MTPFTVFPGEAVHHIWTDFLLAPTVYLTIPINLGGAQTQRFRVESFQQLACLVPILVPTDQDTKSPTQDKKEYVICGPLFPEFFALLS